MDLGQASRPKRQLTVPSYAESSASSEKSSGEEFTLGDELDEEEEDLSSRDLSEKYQLSASVVMKAMKKLILECKPGKKIAELCKFGDEHMNKEWQNFRQRKKNREAQAGIEFPTCISVNSRCCFVSPSSSDDTPLKNDDIVKIEMSFDIDGCTASLAHTHVLAEKVTGKTADVVAAVGAAKGSVLRVIKPGMTKKELESSILSMLDGYECKILQFVCQSLERSSHESLNDDAAFKLNKAYTIDIMIGTGSTQFEEEDTADVFRIMPFNKVKVTSVPVVFLSINQEFQQRAFSIRSLEGLENPNLADVISTRKSKILQRYPILRINDGVLVARLKFTLFLTKEGSQDKTPIKLQKTYRKNYEEGEDKKAEILSYCGKVPIGSNAMGIIPSIRSIAWIGDKKGKQKNVKKEKNEQNMLVCTGSFGTYVFDRIKSNLNDDNIEDLELGWAKRQITDLCGHICEPCPSESTVLALGVIDENNRAKIYLVDIHDQTLEPTVVFEKDFGLGINSLSWSGNGLQLLCTFNHTDAFVVLIRKKNKLVTSGYCYVKFAVPEKDKSDYFGVFHPALMVVFIVTSTEVLGVYEFDDKQKSSRADYYRRYGSTPGSRCGFCGIAISCDGDSVICSSFHLIFDQQFDAPRPCISIHCPTFSHSIFAMLDKGQIIRTYDYSAAPTLLCDNKKDLDCTKTCCDFTTLSWHNRLLALGGEDGFLHFWMLSAKNSQSFAVKNRNILSERLFYTKKHLLLGSGQSLRQNCTEMQTKLDEVRSNMKRQIDAYGSMVAALGTESAQRVDLLEQQIEKAVNLGSRMLSRVQQSDDPLPADLVREFVEQLLEALTTVDD